MNRLHRAGFTLVELSIVLVILGLLVGGILAGQSLIRASELRSVSSEQSKISAAMHSFRDKYFAIPGDMASATNFWGAADGGDGVGVDCTALNSLGLKTTCNGDGNGLVAAVNDTTYSGTYNYERFRLYQHIANAGFIEGSYTGITGPNGTSHYVPGSNALPGRISNTGWVIVYGTISLTGGANDYVNPTQGYYTQIGLASATATPNVRAFTPGEAWNIDKKTDDGKPGQGRMKIKYWDDCTLSADQYDLTADYDLSKTTLECVIQFVRFM